MEAIDVVVEIISFEKKELDSEAFHEVIQENEEKKLAAENLKTQNEEVRRKLKFFAFLY